MIINNWCLISDNPYVAPEAQSQKLHGNVTGHPFFDDGQQITTTGVVGISGNKVVTRSGSFYELGDVDPQYEAKYPDAKNRLIESLKE